jgi:hypothetical protein
MAVAFRAGPNCEEVGMKMRWVALAAVCSSFLVAGVFGGDENEHTFRASMSPYNEVPAVSTTANGTFSLRISDDESSLSYRLTYAGTEGDPSAAHIHLGQAGVNGGVSAFLCGGGSKPACPPAPAVVTGTIVASDVIGPVGQGIAAGDLAALVRAIRHWKTYANAHNAKFPGGTLRGQIMRRDE